MLATYRQHSVSDVISDVIRLCSNLKGELSERQKQLFQQHQKWQEDHIQSDFQSSTNLMLILRAFARSLQ